MSEPAVKLVPPGETGPEIKVGPPFFSSDFFKQMSVAAVIAAIAGFVLTVSYHWFIYSKMHIETNNSYIEADIFNVQSRMMGYVKNVLIEEDQPVIVGQALLKLDETDINVEKGFKEAKFKKSEADFRRAKILVQSKLISRSDFELAEAAWVANRADYEGSLLKLKYTEVIAPAKGVIGKTYVKPGQFIQPGQNLFSIIAKDRIWIKANFKETQIEKIRAGLPADFEVDAYPGVLFHGKVEGIYPSSGSVLSLLPPENATGNFTKVVQRVPVKLSIERKPGFDFRPGMSVLTIVHLDTKNP